MIPTGSSGHTSTPSTQPAFPTFRPNATYVFSPLLHIPPQSKDANNSSFTPNQGPKAPKYADLFGYFETTIAYFKSLSTWTWLASAGIRPSNTTSYSLSDIQGALTDGFGHMPFVGCSGPRYNETEAGAGSLDNGRTQFSEVWYYHHVRGQVQSHDAERLAVDAVSGFITTCAKAENAVWYYKRAKGSEVSPCKM